LVIATKTMQDMWTKNEIVESVSSWISSQTTPQPIAACATSLNLAYHQVAWALSVSQTQMEFAMVLLPESDEELADSITIMRAWQ